ncbi:hypothetical protein VNO80_26014 [Phaseolus coccineus]|uniref:Uncharacterized protein n=1 Tax=Phaseolus coccineus TaxID=3886 RepID=A0AAN9QPI4_PHACN
MTVLQRRELWRCLKKKLKVLKCLLSLFIIPMKQLEMIVETTQTKHHGVVQLVLAKILAKPTLTSMGEQRFDEQENCLELNAKVLEYSFTSFTNALALADEPAFKKVTRGSPLDVAVPRDIQN